MHIITQLISFAKVRFAGEKKQGHESPNLQEVDNGVQDCDVYITRVHLLQQLIFSGVDLSDHSLALSTFSNPRTARILRDSLIEQDRMELAIEVATKCNIEADPVWAHWVITRREID